jgi:prepilin-type N-terminal cleavage/methylation domain-containing protein
MSAPTERAGRGFTLLELMVASAVGLIILTAAMAAFELQGQFSRNTERLLGTQASAGLALTMMQRDLENAGLRFRGGVQTSAPATSYATVVRVWDNLGSPNVTTLKNDPLGTTSIVATSGTGAGFVPGTDAFEVYQGAPAASTQRLGAQVSTVSPINATTTQLVISPNPFIPAELAAAGSTTGPIVMFWIDDVHCFGRITSLLSATYGPGGTATIQVSTVNSDFAVPGAAWPTGCPRALENVEVLERRSRYLVYQTDGSTPGQPARLGLHVQRNAPCDPIGAGTVCSPNLPQFPSMVAEGVDDMQLAWNVGSAVWNSNGGWCHKVAGESPDCKFWQLGAADDPVIGKMMASITGAQIMVSSRGQEVFLRPGEGPPAMLNHVPAIAPDNIVRSVMQTSVIFRNLVNP